MNKLNLDLFLKYNYLSDLSLSYDKDQLSFVKSVANYKANTYNHSLYLGDGKDFNEELDLGSDGRFYFEDEKNILYFNQDNEKDKNLKDLKYSLLYRYNLDSKKSEIAYQFKIPVSKVEVLNKDTLLLTSQLSVEDHKLFEDDKTRQTYLNKLSGQEFFHIIDEVPFQRNGGGFIDNKRSQAFIYNTKDDSYQALVDKNENFGQYKVSEDKSTIYFSSTVATGLPEFYDDLNKYSLESKSKEKLYSNQKLSLSKIILIKDEVYVMASDMQSFGVNQNSDFYKLIDGDFIKVLTFGKSASGSIGSDVRFGAYKNNLVYKDDFYFIGTLNDRTCIYKFDGESVEEFFKPLGSIDDFIFYKDSLYVIGLFNNTIQELYEARLKKDDVKAVSSFNKDLLKDVYVAKPIHHSFENDGQVLDGWVLLPEDYSKKESYPAILDIHGGPKTIYSNVFYHEMQAWVNLGYIVFYTNPRGGDAYGDDFADIRGRYGSIDYDDLMAFTDLVVSEYSVDSERLGVTGGSYGGFMTNWIVSHTDRFKAAATQRSISNWVSFYGTSDIGPYFQPDQTGGHPLRDHDKVWSQSPLKYADNIKTPLLFIHAEEDYRCPIEQAMQLYSVLKMNKVETKLVWFKGENHDLSRSGKPQARLLRLEEISKWLNLHLGVK